ncbi:MAG TPA: hypothetical protein VGC22_02540 [Chitinophaga sp.]
MVRILIFSMFLCSAGWAPTAAGQQAWRIVPGRSIGYTSLGETGDSMALTLGKPDGGDAAMGKAWAVYYNKNAAGQVRDSARYLAVYLVRDEGSAGMRVRQIRINTASFRAGNDIKVGASLQKIKAYYPGILRAGIYQDTVTHTRYYLYDAVQKGIAFEINANTNTCTAITVHAPAQTVTSTYLSAPGYERMKQLQ